MEEEGSGAISNGAMKDGRFNASSGSLAGKKAAANRAQSASASQAKSAAAAAALARKRAEAKAKAELEMMGDEVVEEEDNGDEAYVTGASTAPNTSASTSEGASTAPQTPASTPAQCATSGPARAGASTAPQTPASTPAKSGPASFIPANQLPRVLQFEIAEPDFTLHTIHERKHIACPSEPLSTAWPPWDYVPPAPRASVTSTQGNSTTPPPPRTQTLAEQALETAAKEKAAALAMCCATVSQTGQKLPSERLRMGSVYVDLRGAPSLSHLADFFRAPRVPRPFGGAWVAGRQARGRVAAEYTGPRLRSGRVHRREAA